MELRNLKSKDEALKDLAAENFDRRIVSFYRYVYIAHLQQMRDTIWRDWNAHGVLGRIYIAQEGINAQISVPEPMWERFVSALYKHEEFVDVPFRFGLKVERNAFWKLMVKVKEQIVADGLSIVDYDISNVGRHVTAEEFNKLMDDPDTVVLDMRNQYESRIGHFKNALLPEVNTFREELPAARKLLKGSEKKNILLYCTGGIRCEKASAYLKHHGFQRVHQLHGGVISYKYEVEEKGLENKFKGKNFVFDNRMDEKVSDEVLAKCDQCSEQYDTYTDCKNMICNQLFIQCGKCAEKYDGCCCKECQCIYNLPEEEYKALRKQQKPTNFNIFVKRMKPLASSQ
jgi:UPF0176 protein